MAIATVATLVTRVQTLVDDPGGSWATYDYLKGFMLQANEDLNTELDAYNLSYNQEVEELLNVPANTQELSAYMGTGQPLENLMAPISVEWRKVGGTADQWLPVKRKDKVLDSTTASEVLSWEWRKQDIYITPCINAVDLRVRFDSITADQPDDTTVIIRGATNVLAYRTARLVSSIRGGLSGSGKPLAEEMATFEMEAKDNYEALCIKRTQSIGRRFGRSSGGSSGSARWTTPVL